MPLWLHQPARCGLRLANNLSARVDREGLSGPHETLVFLASKSALYLTGQRVAIGGAGAAQ